MDKYKSRKNPATQFLEKLFVFPLASFVCACVPIMCLLRVCIGFVFVRFVVAAAVLPLRSAALLCCSAAAQINSAGMALATFS